MRNLVFLRIAYLPAAYKKIEGEVVDPTGEKQPIVGEQRMNLRERTEASCTLTPIGSNQKAVKDSEQQGQNRARHERRHPANPRGDYQDQPASDGDEVRDREN